MNDIDPLTQDMYDQGHDGLHIAEVIIACGIEALLDVQHARSAKPTAYPGYPTDASPHSAARMIISHLLHAGWRPIDHDALAAPDDARSV